MKILITGAGGYIGLQVAKILSRSGVDVVGVVRDIPALPETIAQQALGIQFVGADITNIDHIDRLPCDVSAVIHFAAKSPDSNATIDEILHSNIIGTRNIQRYAIAAGVSRFVFASSLSIHGQINSPVVDERTPTESPGLYGASKHFGERLLAATADKLPVVGLRLPGVVGPGASRSWLPTLVKQLKSGKPITVVDPESIFNSAVHVGDLAKFIAAILGVHAWHGCHFFPISSSVGMKKLQIVETLADKLKSNSMISLAHEGRMQYLVSSTYAEGSFGYKPTTMSELVLRYSNEIV